MGVHLHPTDSCQLFEFLNQVVQALDLAAVPELPGLPLPQWGARSALDALPSDEKVHRRLPVSP